MTGSRGSYPSGNMLKSVKAVNSLATSDTVLPIGPPMSRFSTKGMIPALQHMCQVSLVGVPGRPGVGGEAGGGGGFRWLGASCSLVLGSHRSWLYTCGLRQMSLKKGVESSGIMSWQIALHMEAWKRQAQVLRVIKARQ